MLIERGWFFFETMKISYASSNVYLYNIWPEIIYTEGIEFNIIVLKY